MASFGHFIRKERELREWTQLELGSKIGINASAICRIESGAQKFSISKLKKLSEILEIDNQFVIDLFFADKFAREANKFKCSKSVFSVAEETSSYLKSINVLEAN